MNRAQAASRVEKLEALADPARGGTPAERKTAKAKADHLRKRYGLKARQAPTRRHSGRTHRRGAFVGGFAGPVVWDWHFDVNTGEHSDNVIVHHHSSRGSWKIEVRS